MPVEVNVQGGPGHNPSVVPNALGDEQIKRTIEDLLNADEAAYYARMPF